MASLATQAHHPQHGSNREQMASGKKYKKIEQTLVYTASRVLQTLRIQPSMPNFLVLGSIKQAMHVQFYAAPLYPEVDTKVLNVQQWCHVVAGNIEDHQVKLYYRLKFPKNRIFNSMHDLQVLKPKWHCTCGANLAVCVHVEMLKQYAGSLSVSSSLPHEGIANACVEDLEESENEGNNGLSDQSKAMTVETISTFVQQQQKVFTEPKFTLQEGDCFGVIFEAHPKGSGKARWKITPAVLTQGDICAVIAPFPVINDELWCSLSIDAHERAWLYSIHAMTRMEGSNSMGQAEIENLLLLVENHRCVDPMGTYIEAGDSTLGDFIRWEPISPTVQKLVVKEPNGLVWISKARGLWFDTQTKKLLRTSIATATLGKVVKLPPLLDNDIEEMRTAIGCAPELSGFPLPEPMITLPIRIVMCEWVLEVNKSDRFNDYGKCRQIRILPTFGGKVHALGFSPNELTKGENEWIQYVNDINGFERVGAVLKSAGYQYRSEGVYYDEPHSNSFEHADLIKLNMLCAKHKLPVAQIYSPAKCHVEVVDLATIQPIQLCADIIEMKGKAQVALKVKLGDREFDSEEILSANRYVWEIDELTRFNIFNCDNANLSTLIRNVGPNVWMRIAEGEWAMLVHQLATLKATLHKENDGAFTIKQIDLLEHARNEIHYDGELGEYQKKAIGNANALLAAKERIGPIKIKKFSGQLIPFQTQCVGWLNELSGLGYGGVLSDDRGMGKTVEVLASIQNHINKRDKARSKATPIIIVMEVKELRHWEKHSEKFVSNLKVRKYHGLDRSTDRLGEQDIIYTSYALFRNYRDMFFNLKPELIFLDEAMTVRSPASKTWKAIKSFQSIASIIPITGTPINRSLMNLWALFDLAVPGLLGTRDLFEQQVRHHVTDESDLETSPFIENLRRLVAPFFMRRTKDDVPGQFPAKNEVVQTITLDEKQTAQYEAKRIETLAKVNTAISDNGWNKARFQINHLLDGLRHECSYPRRNDTGELSAKAEYTIAMVNELTTAGHRVLLFSHFNATLLSLSEELKKAGVKHSLYHGNPRLREEQLDLFKQGQVDVMLLTELGKSGLDIPEADTVIIYDPWIDQMTNDQMGDRAHRVVSKHTVTVYRLVVADTIEEAALSVLERYRGAASAVIDGKPGQIHGLEFTPEDVQALLGEPTIQRIAVPTEEVVISPNRSKEIMWSW